MNIRKESPSISKQAYYKIKEIVFLSLYINLKSFLASITIFCVVSGCTYRDTRNNNAVDEYVNANYKEVLNTNLHKKCNISNKVNLDEHILVSDSRGDIYKENRDKSSNDWTLAKAFRKIIIGYIAVAKSKPKDAHPPRLLFYFNGGLNSRLQVERQAKLQIPCMMADGYYPVFFIWDTAFPNSYLEQILKVWNGLLAEEDFIIMYPLAPLRVGAQVLSGLAYTPQDIFADEYRYYFSNQDDLRCSLRINSAPKDCAAHLVSDPPSYEDKHIGDISKVLFDITSDENEAFKNWKLFGYQATLPVRFVSTAFIHSLGGSAWQNFVRRTRTTIREDWEFLPGLDLKHQDNQDLLTSFPKGTGVFAEFFETLKQYLDPNGRRLCENSYDKESGALTLTPPIPEKSNEKNYLATLLRGKDTPCHHKSFDEESDREITDFLNKKNIKITLIGHSMGGIVINELLGKFPSLPYSDIVVMASAASIRDTRRVIDNYFQIPKDTHFYSLMLHPINDIQELHGAGIVPSGSLLKWIDEMYEVPKVPDDRTFGVWPNIKSARKTFTHEAQKKTLYHVFNLQSAEEGEKSNPVEHGDFNEKEMCFWRPAFWGVSEAGWKEYYNDLPSWTLTQQCTR